ncbi:pyridoxamine 5'-phosphate oxidase family protein [Cohnella suwonensis]|uniref:Pyridoxamine 5'-phosphate oxidase family protein n=1 Tax=Cohnella suwonensis TaxID=696072 RepID=A0ABW0LUA7_9BACL
MIPERIKPALQGVFPAHIVTCSMEGMPNIASLSQVWYVDETHIALSHQFFNKTSKNLRENPLAFVKVLDPDSFMYWDLEVVYLRTETEGSIFQEMTVKLEAIATLMGFEGVFHLKGADIYRVVSVNECMEDWE